MPLREVYLPNVECVNCGVSFPQVWPSRIPVKLGKGRCDVLITIKAFQTGADTDPPAQLCHPCFAQVMRSAADKVDREVLPGSMVGFSEE